MSQPESLIVVIDSTGSSLGNLGQAVRTVGPGLGLAVAARSRDDLFDRAAIERAAALVATAHAVIILPHGGTESIPGFETIIAAAAGRLVHVQPAPASPEGMAIAKDHSSDFGSPAYRRRTAYLAQGGPENLANLLRFVRGDEDAPPPAPVPIDGVYHPAYAGPSDPDSYLAWARGRFADGETRPVIGLWFYRPHWLSGDLETYDALIAEIEGQGGLALALFHVRAGGATQGGLSVPDLVARWFAGRIGALLSPLSFSLAQLGADTARVLGDLDVPVLQLILTANPRAEWEDSLQAVTPLDVSANVAQPEFDGCLIGSVVATREHAEPDRSTGTRLIRRRPVEERCRHAVSLALNWARLRSVPPPERKVAILFHHYPPRNDCLGSAVGLDSFESVRAILDRLAAEGYRLDHSYPDGESLAHDLLSRLTNDRRYLPPAQMSQKAAARINRDTAIRWDGERNDTLRAEIAAKWGEPPGRTFVHDGEILVGGLINGNVFIGMQPPRARMDDGDDAVAQPDGKAVHDPFLPATHHYLAYYRWLRDGFGAQAVFHIGTHGTLEWMPGKSVGLSDWCHPDAAIRDLPNLYPYNVGIIGEGTQAKRRSYACILDHMIPAQTSADLSEPLARVETQIETAYFTAQEDPAKLPLVFDRLWEAIEAAHLDRDMGLTRADFDHDAAEALGRLHGYLSEIEVTAINDGLHVFGRPPEGDRLVSTLVHLTRLPNGAGGSLWEAIAAAAGLDLLELTDDPGGALPGGGTKGQAIARMIDSAEAALAALDAAGWSDAALDDAVAERFNGSARVARALRFVRDDVRPRVLATTDELEFAARGLAGRFVPPGPGGAPTRGAIDVLPTGRNFYSLDPLKIPSAEAWVSGQAMGDALVERYRADHGRWPEQIGMVLWSSPTMRTRGDDVAQILYLIGARPVWEAGSGRVSGVEPIPLEERRFPRFDVTVRASGLFRDTFPNVMELIDTATRMIAALAEPPTLNMLARNVAIETAELRAAGLGEDEIARRAAFRVFSDRPGCYGAGVNALLRDGGWETAADLGEIYLHWGGHAYGAGTYGEESRESFRRRMGALDLTVKNSDTREHDIFVSDDYNAYHGGMNAAVRAAGGGTVASYTGDSNDPRRPRVRSTAEEGRFIFRTRVLNPKWIEGMMRHGYKGAGDLAKLVEYCFQWDATSNILDDWQYAEMARTYAFDPKMRDFFARHNPHALHTIAERLLEAIRRGLWAEPGADRDRLETLFLDAEGLIEDTMSSPGESR
ncbi:cobaltochelatase subunit CobN [Magnetospirillum fulvum]|uniref:Cobaltochelatase subunit CobN n=1 Tax=Magnetospirillum fulvum MGU-K5 TaxID=1316936 RepID=S9TTH9_MAGFU|nr:cobaltochelatase subunit CobN [Magnetospirillum fulvum]EPY01830.1 cobaltochelatase [Magnetospirillum fulvum MGU-K5]